ncbi:hypothetical protein [uncultured Tolumonas sp.]|uniref:hypothetical protein n=1 Tax=uncultured Tolumonas sp. TaxID=263765 RepID=UPI002A0A7AC3|nr:hypothetical protein [uncultured Tolumonas sp.]
MKLMKAKRWADREFASGSQPDLKTMKKWVESGEIAGKIIGGTVYVYEYQLAGLSISTTKTVHQLLAESS